MGVKNVQDPTILETSTGITRRKFVKYALGSAVFGTILAVYHNSIINYFVKERNPMETLQRLSKESFVNRVGETFMIAKDSFDYVNLQLVEVTDVIFDNPGMNGEVFSLLFSGDLSSPLEQDTYMVNNKTTGSFPLLIVPVYSEKNNMSYEAIFNRLET